MKQSLIRVDSLQLTPRHEPKVKIIPKKIRVGHRDGCMEGNERNLARC